MHVFNFQKRNNSAHSPKTKIDKIFIFLLFFNALICFFAAV